MNDKGKTKFTNLKERLNLLFHKEGLEQELQVIIDGIRDLGNEGAHGQHAIFTKNVSSEDATTLLSLLDYVLERLYVDKARAQAAAEELVQLKQKVLKQDSSTTKKTIE